MNRPFRLMLALVAALAAPGLAPQAMAAGESSKQSLADVRKELETLAGSLQKLRSELVAGGAGGFQAAGGAAALDRMNAIEAELTRLTQRTEELQNQINRVVADGTNRIGDLEFRLCELEEGCDPSKLPVTESLGGAPAGGSAGAAAPVVTTAPAATVGAASGGAATGAPEMAINEQADFDRAKAALDKGDFRGAADLFAAYAEAYPGGALTGDAQFFRGEALGKAGDTPGSARAYLESFSGAPTGPRAAASLLKLGTALGTLGQKQEACVTLAEVGNRFPTAPEATEARTTMGTLGCQ